jgi:hypothetical protein
MSEMVYSARSLLRVERYNKGSTANKEQQILFDLSVAHIRKQGKPSAYMTDDQLQDVVCEYHGQGGGQCAAGIFIKKYETSMEGKTWHFMVENYKDASDRFEPLSVRHAGFVSELQGAHDAAARQFLTDTLSVLKKTFLESYEHNIEQVASKFNLEYRAP